MYDTSNVLFEHIVFKCNVLLVAYYYLLVLKKIVIGIFAKQEKAILHNLILLQKTSQ